MCKLCDEGRPQDHGPEPTTTSAPPPKSGRKGPWDARRGFLKAGSAAAAAASFSIAPTAARADNDGDDDRRPEHSGRRGRRILIRGGAVMSMDPKVGDFVKGDVLVEGSKILAVGANLEAGGAAVIDARGRIVMPGFVDTHHHLFETAVRSTLPDALLFDGLDAATTQNYFQKMLLGYAPTFRPQDVYISTLFGALSSLDAGVTTVFDISQIHHSPEHSDATIKALRDAGGRAVFGFFESAGASIIGTNPGNRYPSDARRIKLQHFSSSDQLLTMFMGGEIYLAGYEAAWAIGRELGIPVAAHIVGTFGMRATFDALATAGAFTSDNLFVHMTGMSDFAWQKVRDSGAAVSLSVPIEMNMRHGTPPIQKAIDLGIPFSLSTDVECTLTADLFTQMRTAMALQRMFVNGRALGEGGVAETSLPALAKTRDALRWATVNGARDLKLEKKCGSLTPGKDADIIILDAEAINVAPLNHVPGAVVTLMERSNVESVMVAGRIRKWKGRMVDVNLPKLRREIEATRDYVMAQAGVAQDLFRAP